MNSALPRLTVGLPVYNGERYLAQAIESYLGQTFTDFELVISDNASTDATADICRRYAGQDRRIRYSRNEKNLGAGPNLNKVYHLSQPTPFFKWTAADDAYAPRYLEACMAALESDPTVVVAHSRAMVIDEQGDPMTIVGAPKGHYAGQFTGRPAKGQASHGMAAEGLAGWPADTNGRYPAAASNGGGTAVAVAAPAGPRAAVHGSPHKVRWEDHYDRTRSLHSYNAATRFREVLIKTRRCFEIWGVMRRTGIERTHLHESYYGSDKVMLSALALAGRFVEVPEVLYFRRHHGGSSDSIRSARARDSWMDTSRKSRRLSISRVNCLRGYHRSLTESPLGLGNRLYCYATLSQYLLQGERWMAMLREPW